MKSITLEEYDLEIFEDGTVLNTKTGRSLGNPHMTTYQTITLYSQGHRQKNILLHRLIFQTFHGPIPYKSQVKHIDGNKANNSIDNLTITTPSESQLESYRAGNRKKPEMPNAVLSPEGNEAIQALASLKWGQRKIAAALGVSQCTVSTKLKDLTADKVTRKIKKKT